MAARCKRWGSKYRIETGPCIARARTRFVLCPDYDHYNWFRTGKQERAALDRRPLHTGRLLADHATCVFGDQADADRAGGS